MDLNDSHWKMTVNDKQFSDQHPFVGHFEWHWSKTRHFTLLCFSFLINKRGRRLVITLFWPTSSGFIQKELDNAWELLHTVPHTVIFGSLICLMMFILTYMLHCKLYISCWYVFLLILNKVFKLKNCFGLYFWGMAILHSLFGWSNYNLHLC